MVCAADAGTGVFADEVRAAGHELEEWAPVDHRRPDRPLTDYCALLAFGGGMHVDQHDRHPWLRVLFGVLEQALEARLPTLTICLSAQALAVVGGGTAGPAPRALMQHGLMMYRLPKTSACFMPMRLAP